MANTGKIYANTTANTLSTKIITSEKEIRLLDCKNGDQAVKVLGEFGFGDGMNVNNGAEFEKLCEAEEESVYKFLTNFSPDEKVGKALKATYDYHNLKSVMKLKYGAKVDINKMCYKFTDLPNENLKELCFADNYRDFSKFAREFCEKVDELKGNGALTPAKIDSLGDKAMYNEIFDLINKSNETLLKEYFATKVDLLNLNISYRSKKYNESEKALSDFLIDNGSIKKEYFLEYLGGTNDQLIDRLKFTKFKDIAKIMLSEEEGSWAKFETMSDDMLNDIFIKQKFLPTSGLTPFLSYIFARLTAIKNVRIIMVALNNGIDKQLVRERLRKTYG